MIIIIFFRSISFESSPVALNLVGAALAALQRDAGAAWVCCCQRDMIYIDFSLRQMDKSLLEENIAFLWKKI